MQPKFVLDAKNLPCPLPLVKLKKALSEVDLLCQSIELQVSDKAALRDIPAFCSQQGLACQLLIDSPERKVFQIQLSDSL
ncbi:MAG: hypothetical protein CO158_06565 [Piscirickettsiaceae bacterium CG_4_9_14_3_um_filter_43_564]|nr:sulfurtransferase TusA family protein [Thiomicrospira sp.]OIP95641.1 MAG: hypothetical protein AUK56_04720 [Thiomicrospira sp. CG2_30_44_34]PIQ04580.1 MAG: hypothetical protein COW74_04685 [Piscirickettsiaceae bacterium CG18_big_fil_WC_8_21_14_2_50_44_103]PIU39299.1 MAG: hypothetical protein COT01_02195 [Piscirickettsiaceae bacterium CG07_land_8_20_14_0_80_44_28]PIW57824.1 MAG: hypothetical protein COW14_03925 [Piscirickettsiaceae bacterium CG12_big_fil_rev_8_21_14_0_65_44_934]PIW78519.1 MA